MTRKYLTPRELQALLTAQGGLCASWGCESTGPFEADHSTPHKWDDKKPDQLLCVPCHKAKTKRDVKAIAKVRRILKGPRKAIRKIKSRGFDRTKTKGFDGKVRDR